jgi:hypothetical protein
MSNNNIIDKTKKEVRFVDKKAFLVTITENLTPFEKITDLNNLGFCEVLPHNTLTEKEFYILWLSIRNALARTVYKDEPVDTSITPVNMEYLATIMAKPMSYTLPAKSKNSVQKELGKELNKNPQSVYSALHRLKVAGYLVKTEDDLITPNSNLQKLRRITKEHLKKIGYFPMSYLFNVLVSNENHNNV